jgi:transposase-like protein
MVHVRSKTQRRFPLTVVQDVQDVSAKSAQPPSATGVKTRGTRRPRLSPDEEREIARLYADTSTSTSEICARLGIGESSLYRIVQRQGIPLRGRTTSTKTRAPRSVASAGTKAPARRGRPARSTPVGPPRTRRPRATPAPRPVARAAASGVRFRVQFQAERVFEAATIQDAMQQAETLGATEILGVARES